MSTLSEVKVYLESAWTETAVYVLQNTQEDSAADSEFVALTMTSSIATTSSVGATCYDEDGTITASLFVDSAAGSDRALALVDLLIPILLHININNFAVNVLSANYGDVNRSFTGRYYQVDIDIDYTRRIGL